MVIIFLTVFFGIPIVSIGIFVDKFIKYRTAINGNEIGTDNISEEELRKLKRHMMISGVIAFVFVAAVIICIVLFYIALMDM